MSAAGPVRALVLAARRRWLAARWVESALLGGAVAAVTLAVAVLAGAPRGAPHTLLVAGLCAVLATLTLAGERRRSPWDFARGLDERLSQDGALATAFELEAQSGAGAVARLHVDRLRARLDRRRLMAAVSGPSPAFLAALALGAALALLAVERTPSPGGPTTVAARAGAALGRVSALAAEPAAVPGGELERALAAVHALEDLRAADLAEREQAGQALRDLLAAGTIAGTEAEGLARALLERLGPAAGDPPPGPAGGAGGEGPGAAAGSGEPALAGEPGGRTMSGLPVETPVPPTPSSAASVAPVPAPGGPAGRWWPRRHDAVVAGYLQARRASLAPAAEGGR